MAYTMIASWGSSGAGKSTVALGLAAQLAHQKNDVLIISMDSKTPALPVMLPGLKLDARHSIGSLFEADQLSEAQLKDKIHQHPKSDHLFFMGLASGEISAISYHAPDPKQIQNLFQVLRDYAPFSHIIVDCDTSPIYDSLTMFALQSADYTLRIVTPDVKGNEWQRSQLSWLGNNEEYRVQDHIRIATPVYAYAPIAAATALFEGFDYTLDWSKSVADRVIAGELLRNLDDLPGKHFERKMKQLCDRILKED